MTNDKASKKGAKEQNVGAACSFCKCDSLENSILLYPIEAGLILCQECLNNLKKGWDDGCLLLTYDLQNFGNWEGNVNSPKPKNWK